MAQRAIFGGLMAAIFGILTLGLFYLFAVLGWIGVGILLLTKQIERDPQVVVLWLIGGAVLAWWTRNIVRFFSDVRVVEIADDGTWILNGLLFRRGTILPDEPRSIQVLGQIMTNYTGASIQRIPLSRLAITARGRTWRTCSSRRVEQEAGIALLAAWIKDHPAA